MLDKFWESLGGDLATTGLQSLFSPAFLFWALGAGVYVQQRGWQTVWQQLSSRSLPEQSALLLAALGVLLLSGTLMQRLRFGVLRLLEGYWHFPLNGLADWLAGVQNQRIQRMEAQLNDLQNQPGAPTRRAARTRARLETQLARFPVNSADTLPTALGNLLRAAETRPKHNYGLDAYVCWAHLWLLLPDNARADLSAARQSLMNLVELWAWGLLSLLWVAGAWWTLPLSLLWLWLAWKLLLHSAAAYADLLTAAFDLYRWRLYTALRLPLPTDSATEPAAGQQLTELLWRGTVQPLLTYTPNPAE